MEFIRLTHENMTGGHLGRRRTEAQVQRRGYWPGWSEDVCRFSTHLPAVHVVPPWATTTCRSVEADACGEPFERVSIDITGLHPGSLKGHVFFLTVMWTLSRSGRKQYR